MSSENATTALRGTWPPSRKCQIITTSSRLDPPKELALHSLREGCSATTTIIRAARSRSTTYCKKAGLEHLLEQGGRAAPARPPRRCKLQLHRVVARERLTVLT